MLRENISTQTQSWDGGCLCEELDRTGEIPGQKMRHFVGGWHRSTPHMDDWLQQLRETDLTCSSACIKMNSHLSHSIFCSLLKDAWNKQPEQLCEHFLQILIQ